MRKGILVLWMLGALTGAVYAEQAVKQVDLKDGTKLNIFADGKMAHEDQKGRPMKMKEGQVMETKDGKKVMMKGNELWRLVDSKEPTL